MLKAVVTTTVSSPTACLRRYLEILPKNEWMVVVAGDLSTPHEEYRQLSAAHSNLVYIDPEEQAARWPTLSRAVGWKCIQRRFAAVLHAYEAGCQVFAFADDDNYPYDNWADGSDLTSTRSIVAASNDEVVDPYWLAYSNKSVWHRGFPLELVSDRESNTYTAVPVAVEPLVVERMVDGDPDLDAICRCLNKAPETSMHGTRLPVAVGFALKTVFNSQNTLIHRKLIPWYLCLPFVGRMDDIFASYLLQACVMEHKLVDKYCPWIVFSKATVFQQRIGHTFANDFAKEAPWQSKLLQVSSVNSEQEFFDVIGNVGAKSAWDAWRAYFEERKR